MISGIETVIVYRW